MSDWVMSDELSITQQPNESLYKINFDGAIFEDQACAGLDVVIRDSAGLIIGALSQKIKLPSSLVMVEVLAASQAISFVREISILRVVVEGNSLQVIKAINNTKSSKTSYGHIIDEIKLLSSSLPCCSFVHVRHEGNKLAHVLVRRAILFADIDVWLEDLPRDLDDVFQFDLL
ncbi:uncharacterized protein LOC136065005 [Quercus suber]|uniref:uncharacterized protein LOC136065005 n=1 Tax=Quercus suber TaxID=58331 RepID=UPI0032DFB4FC